MELIQLIWKISWQTAVLAAVVWGICRLARRAPAAWRHALWLVVLIKFFVPPLVHAPAGWSFRETEPVQTSTALSSPSSLSTPTDVSASASKALYGDKNVERRGPTIYPVPDEGRSLMLTTPAPPRSEYQASDAAAKERDLSWVTLVWLAGVLMATAVLALRYIRQHRLIKCSAIADGDVFDLLRECSTRLGVRRLPQMRVSEQAPTPMLVGLLRPTILLPPGIGESCSHADLTVMLMHELAHVRRWDMVGVWLHQIARLLFFFHPAVWLAGHEMRREREIASDELVLSTSGIKPEDYASGYVSALKMANDTPRSAVSLAMAEPFDMEKKRLEMILRNAIPRMSSAWILGMLAVTAVGLPTFAGIAAQRLPEGGQPLLDALVDGTKRAAGAITSGKGTVIVQQAVMRHSAGAVSEWETTYRMAFTGDRYRLSIETEMLRNDSRPGLGVHPVEPGTEFLREVAIDGERTAEMAVDPDRRFPATAVVNGRGRISPTEGGYSRMGEMAPGLHAYQYIYDIALDGRGFPGNGMIDLSQLKFDKNPIVKNVATRLGGREVVNGSVCYIVEKKVITSSQEHPSWLVRMWVDPSRGFTIPRVRWYDEVKGSGKQTLREKVDVQFRRYAHGVWGPAKVVRESYMQDRGTGKYRKDRTTTITYSNDFRVNVPVSEKDLELVLPPGTRVCDEASGRCYRLPGDGDSLVVSAGAVSLPPLPLESGPGVIITLKDADPPATETPPEVLHEYVVHDTDLSSLVDELFSAGAEIVWLNRHRVYPDTPIRAIGDSIQVGEDRIVPPFMISAIGPPDTLEKALKRPGGVADAFRTIPGLTRRMLYMKQSESAHP